MVSTVILQVYVIYGIIFFLFATLGIKALIRKRTRVSITLSLVFLIPAVGILTNILYRAIDTYEFNLIGNKITIVLSCLGLINIYFFMAIINDSQLAFSLNKQSLMFLGYAVLLSVLFFIPDAVEFEYGGVAGIAGYDARSMDPLDLGVPVWTTTFFLYGLILSQLVVGFIIFTAVKQYQRFGGNIYGKKYLRTIVGMILMDAVIVGSFVFNWLNTPLGRQINLYVGICIIPAAILLYLGLKEEKE
ncbi:MAG: hypothetical protein ACTSWW_05735 [Promethearchaeota archaeon]